jgi:hypothetical protein
MIASMSSCSLSKDDSRLLKVEIHAGLSEAEQWTREGAHHVLQIRALMASDEWESKGQYIVLLDL